MVSGGIRALALMLAAAVAPGGARADTAAAEVAALLDFCSANPAGRQPWQGMRYDGTPICGSGTIQRDLGHSNDDGSHLGYVDLVQWGNGDPCAGDGWLGVTCDAAGEHVTEMCALPSSSLPSRLAPSR